MEIDVESFITTNLTGIEEFICDLQRRGYTKYAATKEVEVEYELRYEQAYYRVKKHWAR